MRAIVQQLEQHVECGSLVFQSEQLSDEFEQQCGFSRGLQFHPQILKRNSGATGMHYPALSEINRHSLFGRP